MQSPTATKHKCELGEWREETIIVNDPAPPDHLCNGDISLVIRDGVSKALAKPAQKQRRKRQH